MKTTRYCIAWLFVFVLSSAALAAEKEGQTLFNGKNLGGWKLKRDNKDRSKWTVGQATMDEKNNQAARPSQPVVVR